METIPLWNKGSFLGWWFQQTLIPLARKPHLKKKNNLFGILTLASFASILSHLTTGVLQKQHPS